MRGYVLSLKGLEKFEKGTQEKGLTQEQIALESSLDRATVSKALQREKPLNLRSIRRLFKGLQLALEATDYEKVSSTKVEIEMGELEDLIEAANSLEEAANEADAEGDSKKAARLRKEAAKLWKIIDRNR